VALGFAGVLVIASPGGHAIDPFGAAVALGGGLMVAIISIQVRDLTRTEEPLSIVFWFAALTTPVLALGLPFFATAHDATAWGLLGAIGLLGFVGQMLLTASLRFGQVASVVVMDYSALVWASLYGTLIWGEPPGRTTLLGAPLIVAAGAIIAWREHVLLRRAVATSSVATG
jgi:drug/metabolite transporter (DMT)-like permease